jgi:hypothetical protein
MERVRWFGDLIWKNCTSACRKNSITTRRGEQDAGCWFRDAVLHMFGVHQLGDVVPPM